MPKFLIEQREQEVWRPWAVWTQATYRIALNNLLRLCTQGCQDINNFRIKRPCEDIIKQAQDFIERRKTNGL
jgi:plasmid replication initiation protein